jgi:hypothetical protein
MTYIKMTQNDTRQNDMHHNDTRQNDTCQTDTRQKDTQQNDTQQNAPTVVIVAYRVVNYGRKHIYFPGHSCYGCKLRS